MAAHTHIPEIPLDGVFNTLLGTSACFFRMVSKISTKFLHQIVK